MIIECTIPTDVQYKHQLSPLFPSLVVDFNTISCIFLQVQENWFLIFIGGTLGPGEPPVKPWKRDSDVGSTYSYSILWQVFSTVRSQRLPVLLC